MRRENVLGIYTALRTKFRGGVRVQACHAAVCIEFAFGRLGVMTTQASWLAQGGRGVLVGQRTWWLMTLARESIDSSRAKSDRLHACMQKWQLHSAALESTPTSYSRVVKYLSKPPASDVSVHYVKLCKQRFEKVWTEFIDWNPTFPVLYPSPKLHATH